MPGFAPVTDQDRLKGRGGKPLTGKGGQKPLDFGLFDTGARTQTDLLDAVKAPSPATTKPRSSPIHTASGSRTRAKSAPTTS